MRVTWRAIAITMVENAGRGIGHLEILGAYDQYLFALGAAVGTLAAAGLLLWWTNRQASIALRRSLRGVVAQLPSLIGVLFGLNLAFLANDTWSARDRATEAVYREADSLRGLLTVAHTLPPPEGDALAETVKAYAVEVVQVEWPLLGRRRHSREATRLLDRMVAEISGAKGLGAATLSRSFLQEELAEIRRDRNLRISLSQTHVNPLKWLGMAFLGFLTMISLAAVHLEAPRAEIFAVLLFAAAAAPSAGLVLVLGNPYQPPVSISAQPIQDVLELP